MNKLFEKLLFIRSLNLYTPTHFTKINNLLIVVDCWNNRILYTSDCSSIFKKWKQIAGLCKPHRIRYYQEHYYICDTDNHRIVSLDKDMNFCKTLEIIELERPHDIQIKDNNLYIVDCYQGTSRIIKYNLLNSSNKIIFTIDGVYARSFKIVNNDIFISCSSSGEIIKISLDSNHLMTVYCKNQNGLNLPCMTKKEQIKYGYRRFIPNDIEYFNGYFYMTNYFYEDTKNRFLKFKTFEDLEKNIFEDLSHLVKGVPYYMEVVNSQLFMGEIDNYSCAKIFIEETNQLKIKKVVR